LESFGYESKGRIISISNKRIENSVIYGDVVFDALEGAEALIDTVSRELAQNSDGEAA
jgi:hypothetical protein